VTLKGIVVSYYLVAGEWETKEKGAGFHVTTELTEKRENEMILDEKFIQYHFILFDLISGFRTFLLRLFLDFL
jgi:hypothetical protein